MNNSRYLSVVSLVFIAMTISSCSVVGGIFKTGMGVGVFIVLAVIILIVALVLRAGKGQK